MSENISKYVDFTLLKADANTQKYEELCAAALENKFYSVCVPPDRIKECKQYLKGGDIKIATVIGFPLGYSTIETKSAEIKDAIENGADELDVVINVSRIKSGEFDYVKRELSALRQASKGKILKVIIENCYLTPDEIAKVSALVSESGADFVKTSTGFGTYGARVEDVKIMKKSISPQTKIKAAGGIKTYEQAISFIEAGASRIGASALLK
ncbi:MAG: deoxyribose-phosphate aldolase [Elusimicrobiota bacterium]|jgi:deoxyribose-phosphate aldolase|nr:deoxyribose-phosphate aldolase [Elusimicrobiota bacterium]